jgi:putative methionine-R-sulfoxide reductase with GAF domain
MKALLDQIRAIVLGADQRQEKAQRLVEAIKDAGSYRWVGMYDVGPEFVSIIAYNGPAAPAHPRFPVTNGLTGCAVSQRKTVVVGDVRTDPRYLTAFGTTLSEIIVPVLDENSGRIVGTIDVESEQANAFSEQDQRILEECARVSLPLWVARIT